jgi:hypothetical protein
LTRHPHEEVAARVSIITRLLRLDRRYGDFYDRRVATSRAGQEFERLAEVRARRGFRVATLLVGGLGSLTLSVVALVVLLLSENRRGGVVLLIVALLGLAGSAFSATVQRRQGRL